MAETKNNQSKDALRRELPPLDPERLYSRDAARPYLGGISNATFIRLQKTGRLQPVLLTPSPTGKKLYRGSNLIALRQAEIPN